MILNLYVPIAASFTVITLFMIDPPDLIIVERSSIENTQTECLSQIIDVVNGYKVNDVTSWFHGSQNTTTGSGCFYLELFLALPENISSEKNISKLFPDLPARLTVPFYVRHPSQGGYNHLVRNTSGSDQQKFT